MQWGLCPVYHICRVNGVVLIDPWDGPLPISLQEEDECQCLPIIAKTFLMFVPCLPLGAAMYAAEPMCRSNTEYCLVGVPIDVLSLLPLSITGSIMYAWRGCKKAPIKEVKTRIELEMAGVAQTQLEPPIEQPATW